jgi:hypothetical protein
MRNGHDNTEKIMRISSKTVKTVNRMLAEYGKDYSERVPLVSILDTVKSAGIQAVNEDATDFSGMLLGETGRTTIELVSAISREPIDNSLLVVEWHRMESGRYETNVYLS